MCVCMCVCALVSDMSVMAREGLGLFLSATWILAIELRSLSLAPVTFSGALFFQPQKISIFGMPKQQLLVSNPTYMEFKS